MQSVHLRPKEGFSSRETETTVSANEPLTIMEHYQLKGSQDAHYISLIIKDHIKRLYTTFLISEYEAFSPLIFPHFNIWGNMISFAQRNILLVI